MNDLIIRPYNVIDKSELPDVAVKQLPTDGDPIEIKGEMYYVCENNNISQDGKEVIGVIPLVVRNPATISNIKSYLKCLSIAHRKVQYKNDKGSCDLENCDEMVIT
jgi:hypothetical protein